MDLMAERTPVFFSGGPHQTGPPSTITKIKNKDMISK
jgi:hypothetical protein